MFLLCLWMQVLVLGLYRSTMKSAEAILPYVYTSPHAEVIIRSNDKLYLFGNPTTIAEALKEFKKPFTRDEKGNLGIDSAISENKLSNFRKSSRGNLQGRPIVEEEKEAPGRQQSDLSSQSPGRRADVSSSPSKQGPPNGRYSSVTVVSAFTDENDEREKQIVMIQAVYRGHTARKKKKTAMALTSVLA
jgi:hypothetical protein